MSSRLPARRSATFTLEVNTLRQHVILKTLVVDCNRVARRKLTARVQLNCVILTKHIVRGRLARVVQKVIQVFARDGG